MKILTIVGARPQFIKAATISRSIASRSDVQEIIVHTGQHFDADMSDVFFEELKIPRPDYNLGIHSGSHGVMTGRMLEQLEPVMVKEKPDVVLVYGDTNSTLAGALCASKLNIPIAHVEAGLRSFNRKMPEEINRVLTDHISSFLFAPTAVAEQNLNNEGIDNDKVALVGDVMYDAAIFYRPHAQKPKWFDEIVAADKGFILSTIHRAENTDDQTRLMQIFNGLASSTRPVILPLHPRTHKKIEDFKIKIPNSVHIVPPAGYLEMIWLELNAAVIATDSGGVQKEAYFHEKPCITLRDETEWVELVDRGYNCIVGSDSDKIAQKINSFEVENFKTGLYGEGNSADLILDRLVF